MSDIPGLIPNEFIVWITTQWAWLGAQENAFTSLAALVVVSAGAVSVVRRAIGPVFVAACVLVTIPYLIAGGLVRLLARPFRADRY